MCVVLVKYIGLRTTISNTTVIRPQYFRNVMCIHFKCSWCQYQILVIDTSVSNTTQIHPQHFRNFMCVHWECAWCQCQIQVLEPPYPTLHKYAHSTSVTSCVSTGNVRGASAKYWSNHQHIQHYTNTPTELQKLHVYPLTFCVVLVPNIGFRTTISNTTQICPHYFRNFICVHWECAWCQCQILVSAKAYSTLHRYAQNTSETSCVSTGNVRGASAKYWSNHHHIQHYTNTPTTLQKLHVYPLTMCVVLVPNIGLRSTISNTTQIRPQLFRNLMCVHWECSWSQCEMWVLAPAYPTLHKYAHSTSETSCVSTGNMRDASTKYWSQNNHIQHYTNTPTALLKPHVCLLGMCVVLVPNIGLNTSIFNTTQICPQHFRNFMCGNVRGASTKYQSQNHHIQQYTNTPTVLQKLYACLLGMCVVLVPNSGISTSISNTKHIRPQHFRNFMCVDWKCAWYQC